MEPETRSGPGLRLRLWAGCMGGALVAALGLAWGILSTGTPVGELAPSSLPFRLAVVILASLLAGLILAIWLDRGIARRARRLARICHEADTTNLHEPRVSRGWGELSTLERQVVPMITRYRQALRAAEQLQQLERELEATRASVDRWSETERWTPLTHGLGALRSLAAALNRGFARHGEVMEQNREAARQLQSEVAAAIGDAREAASQAERGFVEVTALLTTIRELERLGGELHPAPARAPAEAAPERAEPWMTPVAEAIRELVDSATESVDHLASGLTHVQEIAEQVHVLGNRSTLIALGALLMERGSEPASGAEPPAEELKQLAREARLATDRVHALAREVEERVQAAGDRMKGVRERVAERLARLEPPGGRGEAPLAPNVTRLLDRVREMIQDATQKAERLSSAGERVSRAAHRLVGRLEEGARDVEGLIVRLSPPTPSSNEADPRLFTVLERERREGLEDPTAEEERR